MRYFITSKGLREMHDTKDSDKATLLQTVAWRGTLGIDTNYIDTIHPGLGLDTMLDSLSSQGYVTPDRSKLAPDVLKSSLTGILTLREGDLGSLDRVPDFPITGRHGFLSKLREGEEKYWGGDQ